MIGEIEQTWIDALTVWAQNVPSINKAWVFGSRVKDTCNEESDLDIAVELKPDDGKVLADWIMFAKKWREGAQDAVGTYPTIDLQRVSQRNDGIVHLAIAEHGILFYEKGETS